VISTVMGGPVPPVLTYRSACPGKEQFSCELLKVPAAVSSDIFRYIHGLGNTIGPPLGGRVPTAQGKSEDRVYIAACRV
jgi:hypothetical protein